MQLQLSQKINLGIFLIVVFSMSAVAFWGNRMLTQAIDQKMLSSQTSTSTSATSLKDEISFYYSFQATLLVITVVAVLVTFLFGMIFSHHLIEPIHRLVIASQRIAHGKFDYQVPVTSTDEIGQLSQSLNMMSANIAAMIKREKKLAAEAATAETSRRKAEELEEANRKILEKSEELKKVNAELDSFVYTASHDLRAPLRGISSFAQFLEEDYSEKLDDEGKEYIREIKLGANNLQELIEDLLTLSHISRIRNPYELCDTQVLIHSSLERLNLYIKDQKAEIFAKGPFPVIKCDRIKLTEVFVNLINNGIKFASKKAGTNPQIEIGYREEPAHHLFWVKDNGIGIDPRYHEQIFGIFKRLHTKAEYEGTGAGLTIVRKIVEEHQGKIWIESHEGQGAKFVFTVIKNLQEKKKLGEILLESGAISKESLEEGLKKQSEQS